MKLSEANGGLRKVGKTRGSQCEQLYSLLGNPGGGYEGEKEERTGKGREGGVRKTSSGGTKGQARGGQRGEKKKESQVRQEHN